jgi:hypothetical protein
MTWLLISAPNISNINEFQKEGNDHLGETWEKLAKKAFLSLCGKR